MNKDLFKTEITVKENKIGVMKVGNINYISLTDLARYANKEDPSGVIRNWMSNKNSFTIGNFFLYFIPNFLQTFVQNFPFALLSQLFFIQPLTRRIFKKIMKSN